MPLLAREIWLGISIEDEENHVARCHGCGYRVQWIEQVAAYDTHNVETCLFHLRPDGLRPDFVDRWK